MTELQDGSIRVPAGLLEFDSGGGPEFPLVEVEDVAGRFHRGRFCGREFGIAGLRLKLHSPRGDICWVTCDPAREVTIFPSR